MSQENQLSLAQGLSHALTLQEVGSNLSICGGQRDFQTKNAGHTIFRLIVQSLEFMAHKGYYQFVEVDCDPTRIARQ